MKTFFTGCDYLRYMHGVSGIDMHNMLVQLMHMLAELHQQLPAAQQQCQAAQQQDDS